MTLLVLFIIGFLIGLVMKLLKKSLRFIFSCVVFFFLVSYFLHLLHLL